ncbi:MAG: hypothetical protein PHH11_09560 [Methylomonas sp.]|nr:hypothetical protein [Methylomonas sp.]
MTEEKSTLKDTTWLSQKLNLSISTIERWRRQNKALLPPHLTIGKVTIRYDEKVVNDWLLQQTQNNNAEANHGN